MTPEQALDDISEKIARALGDPGVRFVPLVDQVARLLQQYQEKRARVDELERKIATEKLTQLVSYETLAARITG